MGGERLIVPILLEHCHTWGNYLGSLSYILGGWGRERGEGEGKERSDTQ